MPTATATDDQYEVIIVGSGIASSFFLHGLLRANRVPRRILVLEAGGRYEHAELLRRPRHLLTESPGLFENKNPEKPWPFTRAFGGGSNCWFGSTPRQLPEDFQMRSRFGVGTDWPLSYDDLEPFYAEAEQLLAVSGANPMPYPMSRPYPLPPHRFSEPDELLHRAYPHAFFHLPTARASQAGPRNPCCNNGVCALCPVDAKFTVANGLSAPYEHPAVTLLTGAPVTHLETSGSRISGVAYRQQGRERVARADLVVLGANALFNPFLLLRSGLDHPQTGRGLCEQVGVKAMITLAGLKNLQGSTITTGLGFNDLLAAPRADRGAFLYHTVNRATNLSLKPGRELCQLEVIVAIEDLRQERNRVTAPATGDRPVVTYHGHSDYAQRTVARLPDLLADYLAPLPVENLEISGLRPTESHIQGTTVMGSDPATSVVDGHCLHYTARNLVVLGSGNFPTASPANPSLTIAALALFSAHHLRA